jgi:nitrate reductase NapE component
LINFPIQIANIVLAVFFLSFSLAFRNQKKTMALFWMFQLIFFGLTGLLNILDPVPYYLTQIATFSDLQKASLFTLVAHIFVAAAQVVFTFKRKRDENHELLLSKTDYQRVKRKIRNILVLYVILMPVVINFLGGTTFLLRRTRFGFDLSNLTIATQSIFESILYVPPLICLLTLLYFKNHL